MTLNERIAEEAKTWLGVPYQHRSWSKNGCDCTGLLLGILQELGFGPKYNVRLYPKDWNLHAMADAFLLDELGKYATRVSRHRTMPGDILLFYCGRCLSHVGIKMEKDLFIHVMEPSGCKYMSLGSRFNKRLRLCFRFDEEKLKGVD